MTVPEGAEEAIDEHFRLQERREAKRSIRERLRDMTQLTPNEQIIADIIKDNWPADRNSASSARDIAKHFGLNGRPKALDQFLNPGYKTVCLCGSMRFFTFMLDVAERETLLGNFVHLPLVRKDADMAASNIKLQQSVADRQGDGMGIGPFLDAMHRSKIDASDEIIVCTNNAGYIGESTQAEIAYAATKLKPIRFALDPSTPSPGEDSDDYK